VHHLARLVVAVTLFAVGPAAAQTLPELPRATVDVTMPAQSGRTWQVPAGGDLQAALDGARPGDVVTLAAGAVYVGNFVLPAKTGAGWVVVRTDAPDSALPARGERIGPGHANALPKIVSPNNVPAIATAPRAHHFRLLGLEVTTSASESYDLVRLGDSAQTDLQQVPTAIVLDRVYLHGSETGGLRRGVALNSASTAIVDSWIADVHEVGADAQAIAGWNGPGPFLVENTYLEASGENLLFGGADPGIRNLVPSDITIRRNTLSKPIAWRSASWQVKNLFELKNAQRVLVDGNLLEHNWPQAQNGYSVLFTVRNQDGSFPRAVVQDVTFTHNHLRRASGGFNILGRDNLETSARVHRILIAGNLFTEIDAQAWGGQARLLQILDGPVDVTVEHNTALQSGEILVASGAPTRNFTFRDNIAVAGGYGIGGDNTFGNPSQTLATYFPRAVFTANVLVGALAAAYPAGNHFPPTIAEVGFVDPATGDYRLELSSPYARLATDASDLGADMDALSAAMSAAPAPTDTAAPTVQVSSPVAGTVVSGTITLSAAATDDIGVVAVQFAVDGVPIGAEDTAAPYSVSWSTKGVADGTHAITARARDAAGRATTSASVSVVVANGRRPR
jgi:hypothetical protein